MFSVQMLDGASDFMIISVICLFIGLLHRRFANNMSEKIMLFAGIILLGISILMLVWLLMNKEQFHWNFDIATGEPVDNYSTYASCIVYTMISMASNMISCIVHWVLNKRENKG